MNYIIIDLEWNQCPVGEQEIEDLPFEIIEIGAVKLDENRKFLDKFHEIIYPNVYKNIHPKTNEIIHMDIEKLKKGRPFWEVIECFIEWCGEEYRFGTWGTSDLMELQRNMAYYHMEPLSEKPFIFYDVQKLFSIFTEGKKNPRTLEYAVDYWNIEKNENFHCAISDAEYTAKIFQKIENEFINSYYSIDFYHNPKSKSEEVYAIYKDYSKWISCEYETKEKLMEDKDIKNIVCCQCGKKATKKITWFSNNMKNYTCLSYCKDDGYLKGKIRVYKTKEGKVFAVKVVKLISEEKAEVLKQRYLHIKEKKKIKRNVQHKTIKKSVF